MQRRVECVFVDIHCIMPLHDLSNSHGMLIYFSLQNPVFYSSYLFLYARSISRPTEGAPKDLYDPSRCHKNEILFGVSGDPYQVYFKGPCVMVL